MPLNLFQKKQKINLSTARSRGSISNKGDYIEKDLYVFSTENQELLINADLVAQGTKPVYKGLIAAKVRTYKNGSEYV